MNIFSFFRGAGWFCALALGLNFIVPAAVAAGPPPLRVLFLGDQAFHHPADRFKQLQPVLSARQIEMEYTDSLDDLNPAKLACYDCLVIYANWEKISPEQEKALLDFVERGGGFVPLHCASFCFLNSPKYIELVGAQFKSHSTGVFKETIVQPDNPVMKGLSPIESWDETYVHSHHNTNRVVLAERRDDKGAEPYTWIREHGKGRVFYTAWGHDERTWSNPNFQGLVENGIRWASANSPSHLEPHTGLKPFEYVDSPAPLPNYVPNAQWGTQGDPIRTMQKPLDPEESAKHLVFPPGFEAKLFAAEPDIAKPIWLAWDERGRLWIAETFDYPNNMQSPEHGHDRIVICEDTKGQGRADKFTVFAEQLSVPTSFVFANGGVIVVHSGRTEFLKDTDGDGKADERRVLFSGWGTNDTHAGPSNLHYGFDNWIWGTVGYSGFNGVVGGKTIRFSQGIYRFKPDGSKLEFVRASNNNTWGLGLTEDNLVLGSTANGNASMYMPIPNRYYEAVNGWSAARLETIADSQRFFPITDKIRQVDWFGKYTAGAGSAIYTARNFPKEYWNRVQFVAEPTGHLLGQFYLEQHGADFIAHNARSFAASDDEWTAPICAEVGPDGALWMIDWYNYVIQHNPTPRGFQTGKGNAYETPLRDKIHGRIYRVVYNQARAVPPMRLDKASPQELVATLKNDNLLWRLTAQRLLVLRGNKDVVPTLLELVKDTSVDETGLNAGAIHALWTLHGLDALPQNANDDAGRVIIGALKHPSAGVRRAAIMTLPRSAGFDDALLASGALKDPDAQVRLAALLALSEMPESASAGGEVFALLQESRNVHDHWISDAATCAAARNDAGFLRAVLTGQGSGTALSSETDQIVRRVTKNYAERGPVDSIVPTLTALKGASPELAMPILDGLVSGWPQGQAPALGEAEKNTLTALMQSLPESVRDRLLALSQAWGRTDIFGTSIEAITGTLKKQIADVSIPDDERIAAARRLLGLNGKTEVVELVLAQVNPLTPPALSGGLVEALTASHDADTGQSLTAHWQQLTPATRRIAIATLMRRSEWARALLDAVEKGAIGRNDLAPEQWSQLKSNPNRTIARRAERLAGASGKISADRQEIVNKLLPLAKEKGDSTQGKQIFTANCAVCHTFNGQGGKVGPDLSGIGARDRTEILIDILDPNRSVEANYRLWNVTTKDGETFSGRLETETQTSVEILDTAGQKHVIERKKIATLEGTQLSIMPNGFEALPPESIKSLLDFLTQPHA